MLGSPGMSLKCCSRTLNHVYSLPSLTLSISSALPTWTKYFSLSFKGCVFPPYLLESLFCISNRYYVQAQKLMATGSYLSFPPRRKIQALCWLLEIYRTQRPHSFSFQGHRCVISFEQLADKHQEVLMNNNDWTVTAVIVWLKRASFKCNT